MVVNRKLTDREETARKNLERIYHDAKVNHGITHQKVNKAIGWSNSVFGQYMTGRIPLNANACIKLAEYFKVYASDIDPWLDNEIISKRGVATLMEEVYLLDEAIKADLVNVLAKSLPRDKKWELLQELLHQFNPQITQSKS